MNSEPTPTAKGRADVRGQRTGRRNTDRSSAPATMFTTGGHRTRHQRDQRREQIAVAIVFAVLGLSALIMGVGYYLEYLRKPALPVATVNGHAIRRDEWQRVAKFRNFDIETKLHAVQQVAATDPAKQAEASRLQSQLGGSSDQVITDLVDQYLMDESLPALAQRGASPTDLTVTPQEVDARLADWKKVADQNGGYKAVLSALKVSERDLRTYLQNQIQREKVRAFLSRDVSAVQPEVKAAVLTVADKAKADEAVGKIRGGDDFRVVVSDYSTDTATKSNGGDLGWLVKGSQGDVFDNFAFATPPPPAFTLSDVLADAGSFHIYLIEDRADKRPLTTTQLEQAKDKQLAGWFKEIEQTATIKRYPQNQL